MSYFPQLPDLDGWPSPGTIRTAADVTLIQVNGLSVFTSYWDAALKDLSGDLVHEWIVSAP